MNQHVALAPAASARTEPSEARLPAAEVRSQRIPDRETVCATWHSLPRELQDRIGERAVAFAFDEFLCCDPATLAGDRCFTAEAVDAAGRRIDDEMAGLTETVAASLPALFGSDEQEPVWFDSLGLALQVGAACEQEFQAAAVPAGAAPSPLLAAIELHRLAFAELEAAGPFDGEDPVLAALDAAEMVALEGLLAAPYATRADAVALVSHLRPFVGEKRHPILKDMGSVTCDVLAKVLDACAAALAEDQPVHFGDEVGRAVPVGASPVEAALELHEAAFGPGAVALPSPIHFAIALHRRTWATLQASNAFLDATGKTGRKSVVWSAEDAEAETLFDIGALPCASRKDATALLSHLRWYFAKARPHHPKEPALRPKAAAPIKARMADLALMLGEPTVAREGGDGGGTDLPALIEVHRAAWSAYVAVDPGEDFEAHLALSAAADKAAEAVLATPCTSMAEGERLVAHSAWYAAALEEAGEYLAEDFTCTAGEIAARAGDWSVVLAGDGVGRAVPGGAA